MNDFDPLISTREAMKILSESRTSLCAKLRGGKLAAVKDSGSTKIRASELRRYMDSLPKAKFAPSCYNADGVA
jgi:hypothetical protein